MERLVRVCWLQVSGCVETTHSDGNKWSNAGEGAMYHNCQRIRGPLSPSNLKLVPVIENAETVTAAHTRTSPVKQYTASKWGGGSLAQLKIKTLKFELQTLQI